MVPLLAGLAVLLFLILLGQGFTVADIKRLARSTRTTGGIVLVLATIALLAMREFGLAFLAGGAAWGLLAGTPPPWSRSSTGGSTGTPPARTSGKMSHSEALKVLGLQDGASDEQIRAAHRRLILQIHPDVGGSDYLAAKINEAKDVLVRR